MKLLLNGAFMFMYGLDIKTNVLSEEGSIKRVITAVSLLLAHLEITQSSHLVNVNTTAQLANQVFTQQHKCHEGSAEFTQKQMSELTLATGKSMDAL